MLPSGPCDLGDLVQDKITKLKGIVSGIFCYLNGCRRIAVQPRELKDGKPVESQVFDEPQLIVLKKNAIEADKRKPRPGGYQQTPLHKSMPRR